MRLINAQAKSSGVAALLTFLGCFYVNPTIASAAVNICNSDHETTLVVGYIGWQNGRWEAHGWFHIEPSQCRAIIDGDDETEVYLAVLENHGPISRILNFGVEKDPQSKNYSIGVQEAFCVREDSFQFYESHLSKHRDCGGTPGYHMQIFNLKIATGPYQDYSLNIN